MILDVFMPANPEIGESLHSAKWQADVTENTVDFTNVSRDDVKLAQYLHAVGAGAAYLLESLEYVQV